MITKAVVMIILLRVSFQQCNVGCLRCSTSNQCQLCDVTSSYVFSGGVCVVSTQTNCKTLAQNGNCVFCNTNFFLDPNSQKCISISGNNLILGCAAYTSSQMCVSCAGNFFVQTGKCAPVNITIANCQIYSSNGVCSQCGPGFLLTADLNSCTQAPITGNCLLYTYLGCGSCNPGFIQNQNFYFTGFSNQPFSHSMLNNFVNAPFGNWIALNVCQAVTILNCATFSAFNTCISCLPGFFLSTNSCEPFPLPSITNCAIYSTLRNCITCNAMFFLNNNSCLPVIAISNCLIYDSSVASSVCLSCVSGFYVQNNICIARAASSSINNCQIFSNTTDSCSVCTSGNILTTDNIGCLPSISNCMAYSASTFQNTALQCSNCDNNYYLISSGSTISCTLGTVLNCFVYAVNANTCQLCRNGFYLSNSACIAHVTIQNCIIYDPFLFNTCSICSRGFYNFVFATVCVQTSLVSNCINYSFDGNSCTNCANGFYILGGSCTLIPSTFSNCATFTGTACSLCNIGFMVNMIGNLANCVAPLDYITSSNNSPCFQMANISANTIPTWTASPSVTQFVPNCLTCNLYMYGYTPQSAEAICVRTNQLTMYSGFVLVSNCKRYGLNYALISTIVCMECANGFFLTGYQALAHTSASTQCISSCTSTSTTSNAVVPDDFLGFVNICIPVVANGAFQTSGSCQRYARTISTNINSFAGAINAVVGGDFRCFIPAASTTTIPSNYLVWTPSPAVENNSFFVYDVISATIPLTTSLDFTHGYNNFMDATSSTPNVFNFHGIIRLISDSNLVLTGANLLSNNLLNCDIIWNQGLVTPLGSAFNGGAAGIVWNPAVQGTSYSSCLRCNYGFRLAFTATPSTTTNSPFPSCTLMNNCAGPSLVYGGLPTYLNTVFSCHFCGTSSGQNMFPTIVMDVDAVGTTSGNNMPGVFLSYTLTGIYSGNGLSIAQANNGFLCAVAPTSILTADTPATSNSFPNCAAYGIFTAITTYAVANAFGLTSGAFSAGTVFNVCIACGPNFFPVYASGVAASSFATGFTTNSRVPSWTVFSCTASVNCDSSVLTQFNSCGRCRVDQENNSVPAFYGFLDFTLTNCYQTTTKNCFILNPNTFSLLLTINSCSVCKAGFFLNADFVCESYSVPNMGTSGSVFVNSFYAQRNYPANVYTVVLAANDVINIRINYLLSFRLLQYGANSCANEYTQAPAHPWIPRVCVLSSYVYNTTGNYPSNSAFINNCVRYNLTTSIGRNLCASCVAGFIPVIDGLTCVSNLGQPNCLFAQSGTNIGLCYQCATGFMNINGLCSVATIPNCAVYVNNAFSFSNPSVLTCAGCINGFVLSSNSISCTQGNINNCITYSQGLPNQCTSCSNGFVLLTLTSGNYCYPIAASLNCQTLNANSISSGANYGSISCSKCNANSLSSFGARTWTALNLLSSPQSFCMAFTLINNCGSYSQNDTQMQSNTFGCLQCSTGFWFSNSSGSCMPRTINLAQCTIYSPIADICISCNTAFFISNGGQQCIAFPTGIFNCAIYSSISTCIQCIAGSYLFNNACLLSVSIANCNLYSANNTCSACSPGFFLTNSTFCQLGTANNCLNMTSISVCGSCSPGFGLQTSNGITNCVQINLANCLNSTTIFPFACLRCAQSFFPSANGLCQAVSQIIINCQVYDTATSCLTCSPGFALNVARTSCNSTAMSNFIDRNCASSFVLSTPACAVCNLGFFFLNRNCTQCTSNLISSGCMSCDQNNNTVCLLCTPNFYMNASGVCVSAITMPVPTTNNSTNITKKWAQNLKMRLFLLFGALFVF